MCVGIDDQPHTPKFFTNSQAKGPMAMFHINLNRTFLITNLLLVLFATSNTFAEEQWVTYEGKSGLGKG
jgi:hypothetical protein